MQVRTVEAGGWVHYFAQDAGQEFDPRTTGKWMHFWDDRAYGEKMCEQAVATGAVAQAKHSDAPTGVSCFYMSVEDMEAHRRAIEFFLGNDMIPRTKAGLLYNWSFKLDDQTRAGEYAKTGFLATLKLADLIDLRTGAWLGT